jgi:protein-L-isoaspartate(D-aspartate) O-methyltransferase
MNVTAHFSSSVARLAVALLPLMIASFPLSAAEGGDPFARDRNKMVEEQIRARGVTNQLVLDTMRRVPRHLFVPASVRSEAYADHALPIGHAQTISQPYVVAFMTEQLDLKPGHSVLEIGTGSGYQAAVLAAITTNVFTMEIVAELHELASKRLVSLGLKPAQVRLGDGYQGWKEHAPFDRIIVTAAPDHIPQPLVEQLKPGGRMVIPVGPEGTLQKLLVVEKELQGKVRTREVLPVAFVPMTGKAQEKK